MIPPLVSDSTPNLVVVDLANPPQLFARHSLRLLSLDGSLTALPCPLDTRAQFAC